MCSKCCTDSPSSCVFSVLIYYSEQCQGKSHQDTSTEKNDHVYSEDTNKCYNLDLYKAVAFFTFCTQKCNLL